MRLLLFLLMLSGAALAGEGREASFKALEPLIGGSWVGAFPGGQATDTQVFEWVYDKKFIRNVHYVKNPEGKTVYEGETIYAWDFQNNRITWFYWNTTGGHLSGHAVYQDGRFEVEGTNFGPGDQTPKVKGTMIVEGETWKSIQYFDKNGQWEERFTMVFKRAEK